MPHVQPTPRLQAAGPAPAEAVDTGANQNSLLALRSGVALAGFVLDKYEVDDVGGDACAEHGEPRDVESERWLGVGAGGLHADWVWYGVVWVR